MSQLQGFFHKNLSVPTKLFVLTVEANTMKPTVIQTQNVDNYLNIYVVYRPPSSDIREFMEHFEELLDKQRKNV